MAQWTRDDLKTALTSKGWLVHSRAIQHAVQFELREGVKVNLYDTGRPSFGGPQTDFRSTVEAFVLAGPDATEANEPDPSVGNGRAQGSGDAEPGCSSCTGMTLTLEKTSS